ncbi:MarR family transcriptional regulator [Streptomyces abyssalis]|uniref:MarR family transcriptional regulator n=1 Tax=Streptomyces abyssalis TaxID=933944 RepID=A0A1E7JI33_9ACTN|nr:MarR family transcriptional regulator [Streptomyces abyssalis]OEU86128.1 MarR family transcriptional regulator [Streptomyces abyssalis]OEU92405.1 MarR family transcriptional regulator [Streptomyces abyssalis]
MWNSEDDRQTAEMLRWGVSRLASRLRAEQPGSGQGLTRLAVSVLANLRHSGPLTPTELAGIEGLQAQSLTRVLNDLEDRGRIVRSRGQEDRRRQEIALTDSGREALRDHVQDGNAWLAAALAQELTPAERGLLHLAAELLQQLAAADVSDAAVGHRSASDGQAGPRGAAPPL